MNGRTTADVLITEIEKLQILLANEKEERERVEALLQEAEEEREGVIDRTNAIYLRIHNRYHENVAIAKRLTETLPRTSHKLIASETRVAVLADVLGDLKEFYEG